MKTLRLTLTGMNCDHCIKQVRGALQQIRGVQSADVALNSAHVTFDESQCRPADLMAAVRSAGNFNVAAFQTPSPAEPASSIPDRPT